MRIFNRLGRSASVLAVAAAVLTATPAFAAPAGGTMAAKADVASVSEADALGRRLVHAWMQDFTGLKPLVDMAMTIAEGEMRKEAGKAKDSMTLLAYERFGPWMRLAGDAFWEEFEHDMPAFERIVGHYFAQHFTIGELRAAVALYDGAYGKEIRAQTLGDLSNMAAEMSKGAKPGEADEDAAPLPPPALSPGAKKAVDAFNASREGQSFQKKFGEISKDKAFEPVIIDLVAEFMPGAMRRWGEKAEASEAARAAQ